MSKNPSSNENPAVNPPAETAPKGLGNTPPPGTYPSPNGLPPAGSVPSGAASGSTAPAAAPPPFVPAPNQAPVQKGRRVGTITMALSLIAVGVALVLWVIFPQMDFLTIIRLSPVVLIFLGIEILVANIRHRDEKLRYDGLSIFVCILLIGGSLLAATVPAVMKYEYATERTSNRLSAELTDEAYEALQNAGVNCSSLNVYVNLYRNSYVEDMTTADIRPEHYVQLRLYFNKQYDNKEAFAKDVARAAGVLKTVLPHVNYSEFYSYREGSDSYNSNAGYVGDQIYSLYLQNQFQFEESAGEMASEVQVDYWYEPEKYYISKYEYQDRLENPENYGLVALEDEPYNDTAAPSILQVPGDEPGQDASDPTSLSDAAYSV